MHSNLISELPNVGYSYKTYSSLPDDLPGFRSDQLDTFYGDSKPDFSSFISLSLKDIPDFNPTSKNTLSYCTECEIAITNKMECINS